MSRAPEHRVQLAAQDQSVQLHTLSSAPALITDAPARNGSRPVESMDVDGALGSNKESAGQCVGTAASRDPDHARQAPAPDAAPSLNTTNVLASLVSIVHPLMTIIHDYYGCNSRPVDQQTLTNLQQVYNTVKPHWKAVKKLVQTASIGKGPAAQAAGQKPSKQADKCGSAKQHKAAEPPSWTAAMGQGALPEGEVAAASEQAVVEDAQKLAGPQISTAADGKLGKTATASLQDPAPGEHAITAAGV